MEVAAYADGHSFNMIGVGEAVRLPGHGCPRISSPFSAYSPALGRTFSPGEDTAGRDQVVILSDALWQQRFGSDAAVIGRSIELEGVRRQIVARHAGGFPISHRRRRNSGFRSTTMRAIHRELVGRRLHAGDRTPPSGATVEQARVEIRLFQSRVLTLFPWQMPASWNADVSVIPLQRDLVSDARPGC